MPFPNLDGRPSSYTDEAPKKVAEYAQLCIESDKFPTRAGLALYIGTSKKTMLVWEKANEELRNALEKFDSLQEDEVWGKALKGEYNSNIAKLLLYNHGYSDKQQIDQTNTNLNTEIKEEEDVPVEEKLGKVLERIKALREE